MRKILLFPFAILYGLIVKFRNHLFNIGYTRSHAFDLPVVCVGNLATGGTGKTPMVEYLVRAINGYYPAILSRGYKRSSRGFRIAGPDDTAKAIGDEPFQYTQKFDIPVVVGEDRLTAIPKLLLERPECDLVIMDDGFQHRYVTPFISIVLTSLDQPFFEDFLLPAGNLREHRNSLHRASAVVVTKCPPGLTQVQMEVLKKKISRYGDCPVFFSMISYGEPQALVGSTLSDDVVLVSGLANPQPFVTKAEETWNVKHHFRFPDHHTFSKEDLKKIREKAETLNTSVLTTEKDAARLRDPALLGLIEGLNVFFVPIEVKFLQSGAEFDSWLSTTLKTFSK